MICVLETVPPKIEKIETIGRTDAHYRNSKLIAKELGADLLYLKSLYKAALNKSYTAIILACNSIGLPFDLIDRLIKNNPTAKLYYISNEYTNTTGGFLSKYKWSIICNYEKASIKQKYFIDKHFLNLNLLLSKQPNQPKEKKYDCLYYGTFRDDRSDYFTKYLQKPIYLSTSGRGWGGTANFKKFKAIKCNPVCIKKLNWTYTKETLNLFKYSLYIEDKYTHSVFNNLANRWYEAGFCNVVMFFDINCKNTISKSEIAEHFDPYYYVSNHGELMQKIDECNKDWQRHLEIQKSWRLQEPVLRQQMIEQLKQIIYA